MTGADWSRLTCRTAAKLGRTTCKLSRSDIDTQAEQIAGRWKDYNDEPTPGKEHPVGRGAHTPVLASSGIAWDVYLPPKTTTAPKVRRSWLKSVGPKTAPEYDSDDPYRPVGRLAIKLAEQFARWQTELPKYSSTQFRNDAEVFTEHKSKCARCDDCGCPKRYQPTWCVPNECWEQFTGQPQNTKPVDERPENNDPADHAEPPPVYSGKRALSGQPVTMSPDTWNVSTHWTSQGQFLPANTWSTASVLCEVCKAELPEGQLKYCPGECQRIGGNAVSAAAKRRKYREGRSRKVDLNNRNPRVGGASPLPIKRRRRVRYEFTLGYDAQLARDLRPQSVHVRRLRWDAEDLDFSGMARALEGCYRTVIAQAA